MITLKQLAEALGVTPRTVWTMVQAGKIPHVRTGSNGRGHYRFDLDKVLAALERGEKAQAR